MVAQETEGMAAQEGPAVKGEVDQLIARAVQLVPKAQQALVGNREPVGQRERRVMCRQIR